MHMSAKDLERYLLGQLTEERTSYVARHIAGCDTCAHQLEETKKFVARMRGLSQQLDQGAVPTERRKHPRIPTDQPARLRVLQPVVLSQENVRILDTSRQGLRLATKRPIDLGALVQIRLKNVVILAEVRHCHRHGDVYHAGVAIQDSFSNAE
jgi:anti-sigma factor RsiW